MSAWSSLKSRGYVWLVLKCSRAQRSASWIGVHGQANLCLESLLPQQPLEGGLQLTSARRFLFGSRPQTGTKVLSEWDSRQGSPRGQLVLCSVGSTRRNIHPQKTSVMRHCQEARPVFLSANHSCGSLPRHMPWEPPVRPFPWSGGPSPLRPRLSVPWKGAHSLRQSISYRISSPACRGRKGWLPSVGPLGDRSASCQAGTDTTHRLCLGSTAAPPDHEPFCSMSAVCPHSSPLTFASHSGH